jgi:chemotaxis protein methyltransferase WspC
MLTNPLVRLLHTHIGLDPESLGVRVIADCLSDVAREFPGLSAGELALQAQSDASVFVRLVAHFTVNESWLFRNPDQFAQLSCFVKTRARPLKLLSLPCARGEEPASIAITLSEAGLSPSDFSIVAGDLDEAALAKARSGKFPRSAFRASGAEVAPDSRWFLPQAQEFVLAPALLARIDFRHMNILDKDLLAGELFDVVFCRNLLIYLQPVARQDVLRFLRRVAAPGALVFTGTAEPNINFDEPESKPRTALIPQALTHAPPPEHKRNHVAKPSEVLANGLQPAAIGDTSLLTFKLAQIEQSANDGDIQGARLRLEQFLREAPTHAGAWYLDGVLASALDDLVRAQASLDRAAYLNPGHAPTLRLRVELARRNGDVFHAERLHARLKRVRHAGGGA